MKIVIVVPVLITGGAETMVARLAVNIDRTENEVIVISMYPKQGTVLEKMIENAGIPLYYIGKSQGGKIKALQKLWKTLSDIGPDVVHTHINAVFYALPWTIAHNVKLVHTIHTKPDVEFPPKAMAFLKAAVKLKKVALVAVSKKNADIARKYYRIDEKQITYVNNPVEISRYYRVEDRADDEIIFINVGRQDENKNQILAIRAISEVVKTVPNARLILIGNGTQHEQLREETERLGLSEIVSLLGERADAERFLAKADAYVSTSFREGLPLSVLEAMAAGLPVIATNVGGIPDIVRDNGILIESNNQEQLKNAMVLLAENPVLAREYGIKSRGIVKAFDAVACAKAYIDVYTKDNRKMLKEI